MSHIAERYTRLSHSYVQLAEKFQKLDVEHMTLRGKVVPLLKALKVYRQAVANLKQENAELEEEIKALTDKYEELKPLEALLQPEVQALLLEAEEQIELVAGTVEEIEQDRDPDLSDADKVLLAEYYHNASEFELPELELPQLAIAP